MKALLVALSLVAAPALAQVSEATATFPNERGQVGPELTKALNGIPFYLGTIADAAPGTFTDNSTTGTAFTIPAGSNIMLQCDVATYVTILPASNANATTAKSFRVEGHERVYIGLMFSYQHIATDSVAGASNCKTFRIR